MFVVIVDCQDTLKRLIFGNNEFCIQHKMKTIRFNISITLLLLFIQNLSFAQVNKAFDSFDAFRKNNFQEKIYVSTDREFYVAGEILWFKVYGMDGSLHLPADVSKIAYVEVIGADSTAQLQAKVELNEGSGAGSFYIPTSMISGRYTFRAYTNWMKNYNTGFFFQKEITIVNTYKKLPPVSSVSNVELKFYPEGGHLVSGIESDIAFQATNAQGRGVNFKGWLLNEAGDTLVSFSPDHLGMGSFTLLAERDEQYNAVIVADANIYYAHFPEVEERGYVLSVKGKGEVVTISVQTNTSDDSVYLLAHGRNIVTYSVNKKLINGSVTFFLDKQDLIDGINHFTIFDKSSNPVAERIYFKMPDDLMLIDIKKSQNQHSHMDMVNLEISTKNFPNSNLSISVFKLDSLNEESSINIVYYLYLLSDLKGDIENPSYYFNADSDSEIDLLMMVHGWSRFLWNDIKKPSLSIKEYVPEVRGHLIQGKIFHKENGSPGEGIASYLSVLGDYPRFYSSKSNPQGRIKFELQDSYGDADIIIGTNQLLDSVYSIELRDPFSAEYSSPGNHELDLNENLKESLVNRSIGMQTLNIYHEEKISQFSFPNSDTSLFYMKGDKHYLLDDFTRFSTMEDIMREYMPEVFVNSNKEGFSLRILNAERRVKYQGNPLILYDGVPVFDINKLMKVDPHRIKSIDVVTKRYFYGRGTFDGIISCRSYEDDLEGIEVDPTSLIMKYKFAQVKRLFHSPDYSNEINLTTPDRRNLLFWKPDVITNEDGEASVEFSTTEETGKYLIVVEGMSADGIPGYTSATFVVKEKLN